MRFPGSRETVEEKRRVALPAAGTNPIHDPLHGQQGRAILGGWEKLGKGQGQMLLHDLGRPSLSVLHSRRVYQEAPRVSLRMMRSLRKESPYQ
jgi:hypothetical protein